MAQDINKMSTAEIEAEIAALEGSPVKSGAKALLGGAQSGATNLLTALPEVSFVPANIIKTLQGEQTVSPTAGARKLFQIPEEPQTGIDQALYRFSEGFTPAAALASPSFLGGPVVGGIVTGGAGLLGGFSNMAAKGLFPESPTGQMLVGLLPGAISSLSAKIRTNIPVAGKPSVSEETGIPMTAGQRMGSEAVLRQEAAVARSEGGAPIFQQFKLNQAKTAEDFANKIQEFSANPNLTATQINEGVIGAVNFQNNRIINKFRAQNRVNFKEAEKVAGNDKIFGTDSLNKTLDDQINYYSSEQMPLELRAVADKLRDLKSAMTTKTTPTTLLDAEGNPVVIQNVENQKLTVAELQKNLESWGKAAKTGEYSIPGGTDNAFKGVAPGTVKNIARQVLNGFRGDLDAAVQSGVRGAKELSTARDAFKSGLKELDAYAETPFVKKFMKDNPSALDPTETVDYLTKATPTERVTMLNILGDTRPDLVDSLRSRTMQQVVESANGDSKALVNNLRDVLKQKSEQGSLGLNDFLFKTPGEKAKVQSLVRDLDSINKLPVGPTESLGGKLKGLTTEGAAATGGWTVGKLVALVQDTMNMVSGAANSSEKLAWMMTNPEGQSMLRYLAQQKQTNKPLPQTMVDSANFIAKYSAVGAVPTARAVNQGTEEDLSKYSTEQLQQMIQEMEKQ